MVTIKIKRDYINILNGPDEWEWWKKQKGVIVDEERGIINTGIEMKETRHHTSYINKKLNKKEDTT